MKLILKSSGRGRNTPIKSDIRIGKTTISINPKLSFLGVDNSWYGAFGYDEDMELSLFLSHKKREGLFKLTTGGRGKGGMYISISPGNRKTMSAFIGEYDIFERYNKNGYLILNLKNKK